MMLLFQVIAETFNREQVTILGAYSRSDFTTVSRLTQLNRGVGKYGVHKISSIYYPVEQVTIGGTRRAKRKRNGTALSLSY